MTLTSSVDTLFSAVRAVQFEKETTIPPAPIIDLSILDMDNIVADKEKIYSLLPHRYEFERLDRIVYFEHKDDDLRVAGYHDVRDDEFWVRGHIPGKPIFPGVMMVETAAHLVSYASMTVCDKKDEFLGFAAIDNVKFRGGVSPGQRMIMLGKMEEIRPRRCIGTTQGFVDGKMIFEGLITGMWL